MARRIVCSRCCFVSVATLLSSAAWAEDSMSPPPPPSPTRTVAPSSGRPNLEPRPEPEASDPDLVTPPDPPVRERRKFGFAGELGWNSLAGLGVNVLFRPVSHLSLDLAAGLSSVGWKLGARGRYNFLPSSWTPTVGVGFIHGTGSEGGGMYLGPSSSGPGPLIVGVKASPFLQLVGGVEYCGDSGFTFLATAGWAVLLADNVDISGAPSADQRSSIDHAYGSGPVMSAAFGYSF